MKGIHKVYHIFPKGKLSGKVGATENIAHRVEFQQGCGKDDYEVLFSTDDVYEASMKEIHYQNQFGYKLDGIPYHELKSKKIMMIELHRKSDDWYSNGSDRSRSTLTSLIKAGVSLNGIEYTDSKFVAEVAKLSQKSIYSGYYWSARAIDKLIANFKPSEEKRQQNVCSDLEIADITNEDLDTCFDLQRFLQSKFPETANIGNESIADTSVAAQRNLHAFLDEMMEFMDALGGIEDGIKNGGWKYWKDDHEKAKNMKISDLSERDLKELKMEYTDMFHFFINWGLMIGMTGSELVAYYIAKNKENLDRQKRGY